MFTALLCLAALLCTPPNPARETKTLRASVGTLVLTLLTWHFQPITNHYCQFWTNQHRAHSCPLYYYGVDATACQVFRPENFSVPLFRAPSCCQRTDGVEWLVKVELLQVIKSSKTTWRISSSLRELLTSNLRGNSEFSPSSVLRRRWSATTGLIYNYNLFEFHYIIPPLTGSLSAIITPKFTTICPT